ncbi:unnamed protein product [Caenorhabditis nigoni]
MARKNECEKAIRFISNSIKNYTEPESLERWCDLAKTEAGYDKCADSFSSVISYRLDRIEDLKGYSLMEKVRLVFLFSRPMSSAFVEELKEAKCTVELNDKKKITYFRSPGGDCVLQADQDLNSSKRKFKGKQIQPKPSSPDGSCVLQSDHNKLDRYFKGKPSVHKRRNTDTQVRIPDNVQDPKPLASPQILPDPPEMDDVEIANGEKETAQEQENQENRAPERKKEENRDTSTNQKLNLRSEEDVDVTTERIQQETPFNGRIDYDDMDDGEYPEFMVPDEIEPPNQHKKRHSELSQGNPKRRKIDKPKEPEVANPPEINDVETRNEEGEEAPEQILEDSEEPTSRVTDESDIQNQVAEKERDAALEQKPETFDDVGSTVNESLNIQAQDAQARDNENNQNEVKIEDSQEETEQEPEAWVPEAKAEMPELEKMSLLKLTEQIEALAFNINLEGCFQQKALRAVRLFEAKDQLISIQDFNQLFKIVLKNLKSGAIQNPTGSSMKLIRLFEHFKRSLIRPLGDELMTETLGILEDEIRKLGESEDEIPVKTIQTKLDSLMHLITNTWADLDE